MNSFLILSGKRKKLLYCLSGAIVFYFPLFSAYSLDCHERFSNRKKEFRDFELAVKYVRALDFQSAEEYKVWSKSGDRPSDIPSDPDRVYKKQWRGWGYYLGTGAIANSKKEFKDFEQAVEYIHTLNFSFISDHNRWAKSEKRPLDIPSHPERVYKRKNQWRGWEYYLGESFVGNIKKEFKDFEQAVEYIHTLNFSFISDHNRWAKSEKRPLDIPSHPERVYKKQWRGWGHYLGTGSIVGRKKEFRDFELAVEYIRALNFRGVKEHEKWSKLESRPADIPSNPHRVYKKQWRGWGYYLGTGSIANSKKEFREFEPAVEYVRALGFQGSREYKAWSKSGDRPSDIPSDPSKVYKDQWQGWEYYLGTVGFDWRKKDKAAGSIYWSFTEVKKYALSLNFESIKSFLAWLRSDERPPEFPPNPHEVYPAWTNARDFLNLSMSYSEAKEYLRTFFGDLETEDQFKQWAVSDERPSDFPSNPQKFYNQQWEGWNVFLGVFVEKKKSPGRFVEEENDQIPEDDIFFDDEQFF